MARKLTILYGSQTGTAQDLAEYIWRESKRFHFSGRVLPLDKYDVQTLVDERLVVFVCATTGHGDEPDNMKAFWKFLLRKSLPAHSLRSLHFAVLGLGDSSYEQFNFVAKRLHKRLQQLGANVLLPVGLCDHQHDLGASAVSERWIAELWDKLQELLPLASPLQPLADTPRQFRWRVDRVDDGSANGEPATVTNIYANYCDAVFDDGAFNATVVANERTTSDEHFQDVRLISLSCDNVDWQPGDVLVVRPQNSADQVNELFAIFEEHGLDFSASTMIQLQEFDSEMPVPDFLRQPISLATIAQQLWDLNAVPRPRAFKLLAINCDDALEREKLLELASAQGQEALFTYANRPKRTILEVLRDFHKAAAHLTLDILFELFDFIKTRSFSIASCPEHGTLDLLVAVVEYKTIISAPRQGLCSNWLKALRCGDRIRVVTKPGTFRIPNDLTTPIVMVGPGTGLAPFRSMLLKRFYQTKDKPTATDAPYTLFFGCRGETLDFHCGDDLQRFAAAGLVKLITAFSRDQEHKIYVQHRIIEHGERLKKHLMDDNGIFLLAGSSKNMPKAVREALGEALDSAEYVETMVKRLRYQEDTWA